jgi:prephenate dehydrogenase
MNQLTIIGCGLIGGSFALGLKKHGFAGEIVGCDRPEVLEKAREQGAIDSGTEDVKEAVAGADLVYLATPVITIMDLLPQVAEAVAPGTLVTDAGSTKVRVCRLAGQVFPKGVTFLGGHPMAGKEHGGIENASANLLVDAKYVVVGEGWDSSTAPLADARGSAQNDNGGEATIENERVKEFLGWVGKLGAEPVWMDAETHDWAAAFVSHLPQLLSTALASTVGDETDDDGLPVSLAAAGFRDMVRLGASPYDVWRDVLLTNRENITQALERLERRLKRMREQLQSKELAEEFEKAQATVALLKTEKKNDE